jgi:flavin reductase (DIM6/NTAB) family NADH-FMN oxidoreductase RutF
MKTKLGARNLLFPMPTIIVGANVNDKPNYLTVAHCGIVAMKHITISLRKSRFTIPGILSNGTFSVNIPSADMVKETDYCGLYSGKEVDKSLLFRTFYGTLKTAPLIEGCPVNMECKLKQVLDFETHDIFIGEVVETHCDEGCLKGGILDLARVHPILFGPDSYWKLGEPLAKSFSVGRELKK